MSLNVTEFSSHIAKTGLASPNKFKVQFKSLQSAVKGDFLEKDLSLLKLHVYKLPFITH